MTASSADAGTLRAFQAMPAWFDAAFAFSVRDVSLPMLATVPRTTSPVVVITFPTDNSVVKLVEVPITVVLAVDVVMLPVRVMLHVASALQKPIVRVVAVNASANVVQYHCP